MVLASGTADPLNVLVALLRGNRHQQATHLDVDGLMSDSIDLERFPDQFESAELTRIVLDRE